MTDFGKHYEESVLVSATPDEIFNFADNHKNFSAHMNKSSWMMGGGSMETEMDEGKGQKLGSHIKLHGKVFGFNLFLDEAITKYSPPNHKEWKTVGNINLLVVDHYKLGFEIKPEKENSLLKVYIDYNLPKPFFTKLLGLLLGSIYAKWCVKQMIKGVDEHFKTSKEK
ncbi:MAG TPA: SRPBCC family protein [Patescibacteria group bacterium]|nr:SRPBCC family protein [Patescibacteria group bacterium]